LLACRDLHPFMKNLVRRKPTPSWIRFTRSYHEVHDYKGTVNKFNGDGIMALFGAPIALEDAPQRAIRSAYSIHREMTKFGGKIKQDKENIPPIKMRIRNIHALLYRSAKLIQ